MFLIDVEQGPKSASVIAENASSILLILNEVELIYTSGCKTIPWFKTRCSEVSLFKGYLLLKRIASKDEVLRYKGFFYFMEKSFLVLEIFIVLWEKYL